MEKIKKYCAIFAIGGTGYATIELLWRGRTHWSMMLAGGICLLIFTFIESRLGERPLFLRVLLASSVITAVELVFGIIFNILLGMRVWDYSHLPYNLFGQICPAFFLVWCALSTAALPLARHIDRKINF